MGGQLELARKAKLIRRITTDPATPDELRRKLSLVEDICRFAETDLHLETGRSYTRYADLGRDHVVWSVFAAPKYSLRPKTWKFPMIGELAYRGFFSEQAAETSAAELRADGYDVYVAGVGAYSTLGFLADPVLNTFINRRDTAVAELIFHELAHRRLYRRGETAFNESFANAVAQEGVRRWLGSRRNDDALAVFEKRLGRRAAILKEVATARARLEKLYATRSPVPLLAAEKDAIFKDLQADIATLFRKWGTEAPDDYLAEFDNNARMNATATYHDLVPFFERLLDEVDGDMEAFYQAAEEVPIPPFEHGKP